MKEEKHFKKAKRIHKSTKKKKRTHQRLLSKEVCKIYECCLVSSAVALKLKCMYVLKVEIDFFKSKTFFKVTKNVCKCIVLITGDELCHGGRAKIGGVG